MQPSTSDADFIRFCKPGWIGLDSACMGDFLGALGDYTVDSLAPWFSANAERNVGHFLNLGN